MNINDLCQDGLLLKPMSNSLTSLWPLSASWMHVTSQPKYGLYVHTQCKLPLGYYINKPWNHIIWKDLWTLEIVWKYEWHEPMVLQSVLVINIWHAKTAVTNWWLGWVTYIVICMWSYVLILFIQQSNNVGNDENHMELYQIQWGHI